MSQLEEDFKVVGIDREARSSVKCGSCECSPSSNGVIEVTQCQVGKSGYVEIVGIDSQVADMAKVFSDPNLKQHGFLIKDTTIKTVRGLPGGKTIKRLILEYNVNLHLEKMKPRVKFETFELRTKALKSFEQNAYRAVNLIISNIMPSKMEDFADTNIWKSITMFIQTLHFEGEASEFMPIDSAQDLVNLTMKNVWSTNHELIPDNFLKKSERIQNIIMENSLQATLPQNFVSKSTSLHISFTLDPSNVKQHSFDVKEGVKSLNGQVLSDEQKRILTDKSPKEKCAVFCTGSDCKTSTIVLKLNCAICVRNKVDKDEKMEQDQICDYRQPTIDSTSTTLAPHTVSIH